MEIVRVPTYGYELTGQFDELAVIAGIASSIAATSPAEDSVDPNHVVWGREMMRLFYIALRDDGEDQWNNVYKPLVIAIRQALEGEGITLPTEFILPTGTRLAAQWHWVRASCRKALRLDLGDARFLAEILNEMSDLSYRFALKANADAGVAEQPVNI